MEAFQCVCCKQAKLQIGMKQCRPFAETLSGSAEYYVIDAPGIRQQFVIVTRSIAISESVHVWDEKALLHMAISLTRALRGNIDARNIVICCWPSDMPVANAVRDVKCFCSEEGEDVPLHGPPCLILDSTIFLFFMLIIH